MEIVRKKLEENWLIETLNEWDFSHDKYTNYVAINTRNEEGKDVYDWLNSSKNEDEYFNFNKVQKGDILMVGCRNRYKKRTEAKAYYGVLNKTDDSIELIKDTTYLKVKKCLKEM